MMSRNVLVQEGFGSFYCGPTHEESDDRHLWELCWVTRLSVWPGIDDHAHESTIQKV